MTLYSWLKIAIYTAVISVIANFIINSAHFASFVAELPIKHFFEDIKKPIKPILKELSEDISKDIDWISHRNKELSDSSPSGSVTLPDKAHVGIPPTNLDNQPTSLIIYILAAIVIVGLILAIWWCFSCIGSGADINNIFKPLYDAFQNITKVNKEVGEGLTKQLDETVQAPLNEQKTLLKSIKGVLQNLLTKSDEPPSKPKTYDTSHATLSTFTLTWVSSY